MRRRAREAIAKTKIKRVQHRLKNNVASIPALRRLLDRFVGRERILTLNSVTLLKRGWGLKFAIWNAIFVVPLLVSK